MQKMSSVFTAQAYRNSPERVGRQRSAMLNTLRLAASSVSGIAHVAGDALQNAMAGGLPPKAKAQWGNPAREDSYWRSQYQSMDFYEVGQPFEAYRPALALGWYAAQRNPMGFDEIVPQLEVQWQHVRGKCTMPWPQVREIAAAAYAHALQGLKGEELADAEVQHAVRTLQQGLKDCEACLVAGSEQARAIALRTYLYGLAEQLRAMDWQLQDVLLELAGGGPLVDRPGLSASGRLYKHWTDFKQRANLVSDRDVIAECSLCMVLATERYQRVLEAALPLTVRPLLQGQVQQLRKHIDELQHMQDARAR